VIGMVDDVEVVTDEVDKPPACPQARAIAGGFRSCHDEPRQSLPLGGGQLGWSTRGGAGAEADAALSSMRPLPSTDGSPIDAKTLGDDVNREVTLEEFDRAESSSLELSRAPLWAHAVPPTGEHSRLGHYLGSNH